MGKNQHGADIDTILEKRHHNGGDFWASAEGKVYVGNPYSTISSLLMLYELGLTAKHEAVRGGLKLIRDAWREDGKIKLGPKAPLYPCYTAEAARVLARYGVADEQLGTTVEYLLSEAHETGGWRCNFTRFGKGPETRYANPGATLFVLDVLRLVGRVEGNVIEAAVESLLSHWETRKPIGPCHYGIGTLFMQVEFPFLRYNLFYYVYVLSFFQSARSDHRFGEAAATLKSKTDESGRMIIERPHRGLKDLAFCAKGQPSDPATARYREIEAKLQ